MIYLISFLLAFSGAVVFTPVAIVLAKSFRVMDRPQMRKVHQQPMPRWGGIGLYLGFFFGLGLVLLFFPSLKQLLDFHFTSRFGEISLRQQLLGIIFGASVVFLLGLIDDKKPVQALTKLLVQIIAAYIAMDYGVRVTGLALPFLRRFYDFPIILSQLLSVLWICGFMNTINLADGLDGLAAGIAGIAALTFFIVSLIQGMTRQVVLAHQLQLSAWLSVLLMGACLGFLIYNFHPARTFMGDSGALFLGFMLAGISAIGTLKTAAVVSLFIPVIVVALPVLDVFLAIVRRLQAGRGIMAPDREHLHHRLLRFGWNQREVVLLIYVFTLLLSIISITITVFKARV